MFITLEGIEGSGKTTQLHHIVNFLQKNGHPCITTREPGGTEIGRQIRTILLNPENNDLDPLAELLLYSADRAQHIKSIIKPNLLAGKTVICDRFFDATTVYQGFARGLDMKLIHTLHQIVLGSMKPDLTLLFDLPVEIGLGRAWESLGNGSRSTHESRFEKESLIFHEKIRAGYLTLARQEPDRFQIINAANDEKKVREEIIHILTHNLKKNLKHHDVNVSQDI
ncbi:MAG: dTMP kinase [Desulfobacteraceae bacterium]|nr:MAG: dTMP kinase [Desulfobacteraceae bacterium]